MPLIVKKGGGGGGGNSRHVKEGASTGGDGSHDMVAFTGGLEVTSMSQHEACAFFSHRACML